MSFKLALLRSSIDIDTVADLTNAFNDGRLTFIKNVLIGIGTKESDWLYSLL